jgi:hypothetical protein
VCFHIITDSLGAQHHDTNRDHDGDEDLITYLQKEKAKEVAKKESEGTMSRAADEEDQNEENHYDKYLIKKPEDPLESKVEDSKLPPNRKDMVIEKSAQEVEQERIRQIELIYEKECLQAEADKEIADFDKELKNIQYDKIGLESDKKYGEMKMIISYEALRLLKGLVDRDTELTERLSKCKQEKVTIAKQFNDIALKMREKDMLINNLKEEKEQIMAKFDELVPVGDKSRDDYYEFFMRKIKRKAVVPEEEKAYIIFLI